MCQNYGNFRMQSGIIKNTVFNTYLVYHHTVKTDPKSTVQPEQFSCREQDRHLSLNYKLFCGTSNAVLRFALPIKLCISPCKLLFKIGTYTHGSIICIVVKSIYNDRWFPNFYGEFISIFDITVNILLCSGEKLQENINDITSTAKRTHRQEVQMLLLQP